MSLLPPVPVSKFLSKTPPLLGVWNSLSPRDQNAVEDAKDRTDPGELELFASSVSSGALQVLYAIRLFVGQTQTLERHLSKIPDEQIPQFVHNTIDFLRVHETDEPVNFIIETKTFANSLENTKKLTHNAAIAFYEQSQKGVPEDKTSGEAHAAVKMLTNGVLRKLPPDMGTAILESTPPDFRKRLLTNTKITHEKMLEIAEDGESDFPTLDSLWGGVNGAEFARIANNNHIKGALLAGVNPIRALASNEHPEHPDQLKEIKGKVYAALSSIADDLNESRAERPGPDENRRKTQDLAEAMRSMPWDYHDPDAADVLRKSITALSYSDDYDTVGEELENYSRALADAVAPEWMTDCMERMHRNGYPVRASALAKLKVSEGQAVRLLSSLEHIRDDNIRADWIARGTNVVGALSEDTVFSLASANSKLGDSLQRSHPRVFASTVAGFGTAKGDARDKIMQMYKRKMNWLRNVEGLSDSEQQTWHDAIGQSFIHFLVNDTDEDYDSIANKARAFDMEDIMEAFSGYYGTPFLDSVAKYSGDAVSKLIDRIANNSEELGPSGGNKLFIFKRVAQKHAGVQKSLQGMCDKEIGKMADFSVPANGEGFDTAKDIGSTMSKIREIEDKLPEYVENTFKTIPQEQIAKILKNAFAIKKNGPSNLHPSRALIQSAMYGVSDDGFKDIVRSEPEAADWAVSVCPRRFTPELAEEYVRRLYDSVRSRDNFDALDSLDRAITRLPLPLEFVHHLYDTRNDNVEPPPGFTGTAPSLGKIVWNRQKAALREKGIFSSEEMKDVSPLMRGDSLPDDEHSLLPHGRPIHEFLLGWNSAKDNGHLYSQRHKPVRGSVEFAFDTAPLRRLRDTITERSPVTRSMHEKEVQKVFPGDWKRFKDNKGMISADAIQKFIDDTPKTMKYNVEHHGFDWAKQGMPRTSHTKNGEPDWDRDVPVQRHNEEESKVMRFNITTSMVHKLKKEGLWEAWKHISDWSRDAHSEIHPTTGRRTLGWIRWTGHPSTGVFWDECQSDLHSDLRHLAEDGEDEYIDHNTAQRLNNILFGGKHPSQAFYEAFQQHLRDHGYTDTMIAVHSTDSKSRISNDGYTTLLDPNAIQYEHVIENGHKKFKLGQDGNKIPILDENGMPKPDLHARVGLSGVPAPVHMKETYDKIPKKNLAMEPSVYDKRNMPTQSNPYLQGKRQIWQGKNRKSEAYSQTIENMNAGIPLSEDDLLVLEDILGYMPPVEKALKFRTAKQFTDEILKPFGWEEPQPGAHWKANHKHGGMWRGFSQSDIANGLDNVRQVYFLNQLGLRHFAVGGEETFGYQPGSELENAYKAWGAPTIDQARAKLQSEISAKKASSALKLQFGKDANVMAVPGVPFENYVPIEKLSHGISDEEIAHPNFQHRVKNVTPGVIPAIEMDGQLVTTNDELLAHARQNGYTHVPVKMEG